MKYISFISVFCLYIEIIHGKAGKCDIGWENHGHKCYKLIYPPAPGKATEQIHLCKKSFGDGARALGVYSQDENDWVVDFATKTLQADGKYEAPDRAWILTGGLRPPGGDIKWDTGDGAGCPLNYTNWAPGEPFDDMRSVSIYLEKTISPYQQWKSDFYGKWNDFDWDSCQYPVMCEKNAKDARFDPKTCTYVEDCIKIKKSTLMGILESCACSDS